MAYQLQITTAQGTQILPLNGIENGNIPADPSASYTLIDEQGNPVTEDLSLTRKGDNLALEVEGESVANIEEFYSVDGSQYVVDGSQSLIDGSAASAESTVISSSGIDASGNMIAEGAVWQAKSSFLGLSTLQLVGAGLGSAVVVGAAVSGSDSDSGSSTTSDNTAPEITSGTTATAIDENSGANQVVYTVTAIDDNAITYSLSGDDASLFTIDAATGDVTLTADPDYETQSSYSFNVVATDEAGNESEQTVSLDINDLDDTAPEITSGTTATAIDENSGANQVVYTVTATDNNAITYSLSGDDASLFTIDTSTGEVTLAADPDYETQSSYSFNVVATDEAGNESEQAVSLDINNFDDTAPTITSAAIADVDENIGSGQVVYTVQSTDSDVVSGTTVYSLTGTDSTSFTIDSSTGEVTLIADPDYETQSSYNFNVVATDNAGNESEQAVTLSVNDLDEVAPTNTFTSAAYDEASNTLTLTGTDMNTLLFGNEDATTDIKDNFNWDNVTWDINTDNDDSNNISFSLSDIESVYVTDDNTLSISLTDMAATSLEGTTDFDNLTVNDSITIEQGFSGDTAGNISTTDGMERDTSIVVFDLVNGESSSHSDRSFDADVSYTIYIMVSGESMGLSEIWEGSSNLGSDDFVVLVSGDGNPVTGYSNNSISGITHYTPNLATYQTRDGRAAIIKHTGQFTFSQANYSYDPVRLWSAGTNGDPSVQVNTLSGNFTLTALPSGVLTSQGLA